MDQTPRNMNKDVEKNTTQNTNLQDSPPVKVTKTFRAPVEQVWRALSTPESIRQWWGPEGYNCPEAQTDFREGGKYLFAMKGPDGKVVWSGGTYVQIIPNKMIIYTDQFCDDEGNPVSANYYDMPGDWPETSRVTIQLEKVGEDQTQLSLRHEGIPKEMHDDCIEGWSSSLGKLQRLVEKS